MSVFADDEQDRLVAAAAGTGGRSHRGVVVCNPRPAGDLTQLRHSLSTQVKH